MKFGVKLVFLSGLFFLFSCSPTTNSEQKVVEDLKDSLGCKDFNNLLFDQVDRFLISQNRAPDFEKIQKQILELEKNKLISKDQAYAWKEIFNILLEKAPKTEKLDSIGKHRALLVAMELRDQTTEDRKVLSQQLETHFANLKQASETCEAPPSPTPAPAPENPPGPQADEFERRVINRSEPRSFLGMQWTFATAYQSCNSYIKNPLTVFETDLRGVKTTGRHPAGGQYRVITSLSDVLSSHYYYQNESPIPQCFNFLQSPLIYDFGGKPSSRSGSYLDFFEDDGSGTSVLGTDCSGLIYTALATAGLKVRSTEPLEARHVLAINARSYLNLSASKIDCLEYVTVDGRKTIQPGDIAAIDGHVVMIGKTGEDPLGVLSVPNKNFCNMLTIDGFDFEVWQSSPSKNGIGINRYRASDYLHTASDSLKNGFINYAKKACQAKFDNKKADPRTGTFAITRHKGTNECRSARVTLAREACIMNCPQLFD